MVRALACLMCLSFVASARAKIGETVPQLIQRFGKAYTLDTVEGGTKYKFRSANISVDVKLENGVSISETYLSDHPLSAAGEPPNDIVQAILRTNVPKAKWIQVEAGPFGANYAMRSSDSRYIATLNYSGQQEENVVWTLTVQRVKSNGGPLTSSILPTETATQIPSSSSVPSPAPPAPSPVPPATSPISLGTATPSGVPTAATTEDGRRVLIYPDGAWRLDKSAGAQPALSDTPSPTATTAAPASIAASNDTDTGDLSDEIIKKVVTGNELVLASGEHSYPISKDRQITAISRGDKMVSHGIARVPLGTTLYPVKVTSIAGKLTKEEAEKASKNLPPEVVNVLTNLPPETRVFYFYQDAFHAWKAIAEPGTMDAMRKLGDTQPTIH